MNFTWIGDIFITPASNLRRKAIKRVGRCRQVLARFEAPFGSRPGEEDRAAEAAPGSSPVTTQTAHNSDARVHPNRAGCSPGRA